MHTEVGVDRLAAELGEGGKVLAEGSVLFGLVLEDGSDAAGEVGDFSGNLVTASSQSTSWG